MPKVDSKPTTAPKAKKEKEQVPIVERPILYPEISLRDARGEHAMTLANVKELLGWEEVEGKGEDFSIKGAKYGSLHEKKIRCTYNIDNRPFKLPGADKYAQDMLNRYWKFNGETIIIGQTGKILSGQHRLIAFVLACAQWDGPQKEHWISIWPNEPTFETCLCYGVDEDRETVRTIDNVMPRSLADVLFMDPDLYGKLSTEKRMLLTRMVDYGIRLLWDRTGAKSDPYAPRRTHSECIDFLDKHARLKIYVKEIFECEGSNSNLTDKKIPLGTAAGLMYLMACSDSSENKLQAYKEDPTEDNLTWKNDKKAREYWKCLSSGHPDTNEVARALTSLTGDNDDMDVSNAARIAVLIEGWNRYLSGTGLDSEKIIDELFTLKEANSGKKYLALNDQVPSVGGIDIGGKKEAAEHEPDEPLSDEEKEAIAAAELERQRRNEEIEQKRLNREKARLLKNREGNGKHEPEAPKTLADELEELKAEHDYKLLLHPMANGYKVWGSDAHKVAQLTKLPCKIGLDQMPYVEIPEDKLEMVLAKLTEAGEHHVLLEAKKETPKPKAKTKKEKVGAK